MDVALSLLLQAGVAALTGLDLTQERFTDTLLASPGLFALLFGLGAAASVAGGYVAARIAAGSELENAFVSGIAVAIFGLVASVTESALPPLWLTIVGAFVTVAAQTFGGWIRLRTRPT